MGLSLLYGWGAILVSATASGLSVPNSVDEQTHGLKLSYMIKTLAIKLKEGRNVH